METSFHLSSLHMVFDKVIHCPPISSFFAWKSSGLKINISKSRAYYSSGIPQGKINNFTSISGIHITTSLGKYLGFQEAPRQTKEKRFQLHH